MKHVEDFSSWRNSLNEAKFFDPSSVEAISADIAEHRVDTIQFLGFEWQYRINGVVANVKAFSGGKEVEDLDDWGFETIAEYLRPGIKKGYHEGLYGDYIIKKFSKWPDVKLLDSEGNEVTADTDFNVEENSDS